MAHWRALSESDGLTKPVRFLIRFLPRERTLRHSVGGEQRQFKDADVTHVSGLSDLLIPFKLVIFSIQLEESDNTLQRMGKVGYSYPKD